MYQNLASPLGDNGYYGSYEQQSYKNENKRRMVKTDHGRTLVRIGKEASYFMMKVILLLGLFALAGGRWIPAYGPLESISERELMKEDSQMKNIDNVQLCKKGQTIGRISREDASGVIMHGKDKIGSVLAHCFLKDLKDDKTNIQSPTARRNLSCYYECRYCNGLSVGKASNGQIRL
ncbi:hypothetical protein CHS0354_032158 [Potamilus streckersoni]|uniref:Uncharacterized protein n=1 Tax=Potamilus streckersoni TaxID=2493646 RepID=A0AAE0TGP2_9BIVA|nr:hypothetical protein CHS0354_032158 [Potamilus streckersoni]